MRKKLLSVALCVAMATTALAGCGSKDDSKKDEPKSTGGTSEDEKKEDGSEVGNKENGKVYFLNFKPEIASTYE